MSDRIDLSIRLDFPNGTRFGPGKCTLLQAIESEGSISGAARKMHMSYPRALRLTGEMNTQFSQALIEKFQGGASRGGARLTDTGKRVLALYVSVSSQAQTATRADLKALRAMAAKQSQQ